MKYRTLILVSAAWAATALAGPYDQAYAIVESGDNSQVRKESRLSITKVDGKSTRNARRSDPIEPGKHQVTVHFESARGLAGDQDRELQMELEACTRYRIVANYETVTGPKWEPKIYPEPIVECVRKFKIPTGKST